VMTTSAMSRPTGMTRSISSSGAVVDNQSLGGRRTSRR
jgi:hypothetical protein